MIHVIYAATYTERICKTCGKPYRLYLLVLDWMWDLITPDMLQ